MVDIVALPSDVAKIQEEINRLNLRIASNEENIQFFTDQLYGRPEIYLYSADDIQENPSLEKEQKVLFPAISGAINRDKAFENVLFTQLQSIVDAYESERRAIDGKHPDFTIPPPYPGSPGPGVFNETLIQLSGVNRTPPLFVPAYSIEPVNPGQMFGGALFDANHENAELTNELALITSLLTPACQLPLKPPSCQTDHSQLITSLLSRYNPVGPTGFLVTEQNALNANPDAGAFPSNPLAAVLAEQTRVNTFRLALVAIPLANPVPPPLLLLNQGLATARQAYITGTRIPEMDGYLNTTPGYYNTRFQTLRNRVAGSGTVHEVKFLQDSIAAATSEIVDLLAQRAFLESLLPV